MKAKSATHYATLSPSTFYCPPYACQYLTKHHTRHIQRYLDQPSVRESLGVDPSLTGNFTFCSDAVGELFVQNLDEFRPTYNYVAALLERGVDALIYVGKNDWICNHVGNEAWTVQLEWSGHDEFAGQALREWKVDGEVAGMTRSANGLTFATIDGAGHMVRDVFLWKE